jgi:hypothetical protein
MHRNRYFWTFFRLSFNISMQTLQNLEASEVLTFEILGLL